MTPYRAILIAGPTAAGKSALAEHLAGEHGGIVVNADSMQVYSDLEILTARPAGGEPTAVPHALYGHVSGAVAYSVGRWLADVEVILARCRASGEMPVIVGGTGLYFKALLEGLSPIPPIPAAVRDFWRGEAQRLGAHALHAVLAGRDAAAATQLRPGDAQRVTRALEVLDATGCSLLEWQRRPGRALVDVDTALRLVVCPPRDVLYARADARFDEMMAAGALGEARALMELGYAQELPVMRAIGVRPLIEAAAGRVCIEDGVAQAKQDTRHYIKRQQTWLRRNMMSWRWLEMELMERNMDLNFTFTQS
jgi:tRNA dimethylallyltransferase